MAKTLAKTIAKTIEEMVEEMIEETVAEMVDIAPILEVEQEEKGIHEKGTTCGIDYWTEAILEVERKEEEGIHEKGTTCEKGIHEKGIHENWPK